MNGSSWHPKGRPDAKCGGPQFCLICMDDHAKDIDEFIGNLVPWADVHVIDDGFPTGDKRFENEETQALFVVWKANKRAAMDRNFQEAELWARSLSTKEPT